MTAASFKTGMTSATSSSRSLSLNIGRRSTPPLVRRLGSWEAESISAFYRQQPRDPTAVEIRTHGRTLREPRGPGLALSGHRTHADECPLLGVKRTSGEGASMSAFDPKRT